MTDVNPAWLSSCNSWVLLVDLRDDVFQAFPCGQTKRYTSPRRFDSNTWSIVKLSYVHALIPFSTADVPTAADVHLRSDVVFFNSLATPSSISSNHATYTAHLEYKNLAVLLVPSASIFSESCFSTSYRLLPTSNLFNSFAFIVCWSIVLVYSYTMRAPINRKLLRRSSALLLTLFTA